MKDLLTHPVLFTFILMAFAIAMFALYQGARNDKPTYMLNLKEILSELTEAIVAIQCARTSLGHLPKTESTIHLDKDLQDMENQLAWTIEDLKEHHKFYTEIKPEKLTEYIDNHPSIKDTLRNLAENPIHQRNTQLK